MTRDKHLTFRVSEALERGVCDYIATLHKLTGVQIGKSEALRNLVRLALEEQGIEVSRDS